MRSKLSVCLIITALLTAGQSIPVQSALNNPTQEQRHLRVVDAAADDVYALLGAAYTYISKHNLADLTDVGHASFLHELVTNEYYAGALISPLGTPYQSRVVDGQLEIYIDAGDRGHAQTLRALIPNGRISGESIVSASMPHPSESDGYLELVGRFYDESKPFRQQMEFGVTVDMGGHDIENAMAAAFQDLVTHNIEGEVLTATNMRVIEFLNLSGARFDATPEGLRITADVTHLNAGLINAFGDIVGQGGTVRDVDTLTTEVATSEELLAQEVTAQTTETQELVAGDAEITTLSGEQLVTDTAAGRELRTTSLSADNAGIEVVTGQSLEADELRLDEGDIETLLAQSAELLALTGQSLNVTQGNLGQATSDELLASEGEVTQLEGLQLHVEQGEIAFTEAGTVQATQGQINQASGDSFTFEQGDIETLVAEAGEIDDLTAGRVETELLTTESIDAPIGVINDLESEEINAQSVAATQVDADSVQANDGDFFTIIGEQLAALSGNNQSTQAATLTAQSAVIDELDGTNLNADELALVTGELTEFTAQTAQIENVEGSDLTYSDGSIGDINTTTLEAQNATINNVSGNTLDFTSGEFAELDVQTGTIETVTAGTTQVETLEADELTATTAEITSTETIEVATETLDAQNIDADMVETTTLTADSGEFDNVSGDTLTVDTGVITDVNTTNLTATNAAIETLTGDVASARELSLMTGEIARLTADDANIAQLSGEDLTFTQGYIDDVETNTLQATTGTINSVTGDNLQFDNAQIADASANTITADTGNFDTLEGSSLVINEHGQIDTLTANSGEFTQVTAANTEVIAAHSEIVTSHQFNITEIESGDYVGGDINAEELTVIDGAEFIEIESSIAETKAASGVEVITNDLYIDNLTTATLVASNSQLGSATASSMNIAGSAFFGMIDGSHGDFGSAFADDIYGQTLTLTNGVNGQGAVFSNGFTGQYLTAGNDVYSQRSSINQNQDLLITLTDDLEDCIETERCFPPPSASVSCSNCVQEESGQEFFMANITADTSVCGRGCSYQWILPNGLRAESNTCASGQINQGQQASNLRCDVINQNALRPNETYAGNVIFKLQSLGNTERVAEGIMPVEFTHEQSITPPIITFRSYDMVTSNLGDIIGPSYNYYVNGPYANTPRQRQFRPAVFQFNAGIIIEFDNSNYTTDDYEVIFTPVFNSNSLYTARQACHVGDFKQEPRQDDALEYQVQISRPSPSTPCSILIKVTVRLIDDNNEIWEWTEELNTEMLTPRLTVPRNNSNCSVGSDLSMTSKPRMHTQSGTVDWGHHSYEQGIQKGEHVFRFNYGVCSITPPSGSQYAIAMVEFDYRFDFASFYYQNIGTGRADMNTVTIQTSYIDLGGSTGNVLVNIYDANELIHIDVPRYVEGEVAIALEAHGSGSSRRIQVTHEIKFQMIGNTVQYSESDWYTAIYTYEIQVSLN